MRSIDLAQQLRRGDRDAYQRRHDEPAHITEESQIGIAKLIGLMLHAAERGQRHAASDFIKTVGYEAEQIPRHPVKAQRGTSEHATDQQVIDVAGNSVENLAAERAARETP